MISKRIHYVSFVIFGFILFLALIFPKVASEKIRIWTVGLFAPCNKSADLDKEKNDSSKLVLELEHLRNQLETVREWLLSEEWVERQIKRLEMLKDNGESDAETIKKRSKTFADVIRFQMEAVAAKVIFREPISWSTTLWIDVGKRENRKLGREVIAKNSPVVVEGCLVGVVEAVEEERSRVRLLTDSKLVPSVRAVRGLFQNYYFLDQLESFMRALFYRKDLFADQGEKERLFQSLTVLKTRLLETNENALLAKGEIRGSAFPLWRSKNQRLKGVGFHYNSVDADTSSKELQQDKNFSSLKEGDLLVTSGIDGIFPAGLQVGIITRIYPLREGAVSYEIEAIPAAKDIDEIRSVFVFPPS